MPKRDFLGILSHFWGHVFGGGPKWHFSDFKVHSVAGRGVSNYTTIDSEKLGYVKFA